MQTLVNTATIQWIHSTTKYHEAKVMTTKKTEDTCTFCLRNTPTGKAGQTFAPFAQPLRRNQLCHRLCSTITKLYMYMHVPILLLTEIPQLGKQEKHAPRSPATQKTPDFISSSTWLDNNEIIHVSIYFQAHPAQALQLATTHQCCIQAQS